MARPGDLGLLLFLSPVIWGATFPAGKRALETLPLLPFMAWSRMLGVVAIVAALPWVARRLAGASLRRVAGPGLVLGGLMFAAYGLQTAGLERTSATNAGFITGLYVVFTPILGLLLFRDRVDGAGWGSVAVAVAGLALLSVRNLEEVRLHAGDLLVLASAVAWAGHVVAVGRFATRHPAVPLSLAQMVVAAGLHALSSGWGGLRPGDAASVWHLLLVTGLLGSGVAFTVQVVAQGRVGAARASIILAGESVVAAGVSAVWLGERLAGHQWVGAALMVAAMVASELLARRRAPRLDPATAV